MTVTSAPQSTAMLRGVLAGDAAADHDDLRVADARHAAEQHAATAGRLIRW